MKFLLGSPIQWQTKSAAIALVLVLALMAPVAAFARLDAFGGAPFGPTFLAYTITVAPQPLPDRLDRIPGYSGYVALVEPQPMPDRLEREADFLAYTEKSTLDQDRIGHWMIK